MAVLLAVFATVAWGVLRVTAEPPLPCDQAAATLDGLAYDYGETPTAAGRIGWTAGNAFVLMGNPVTGTWTLLTIRPDGIACLIDSGTGLTLPAPQPGDPL